MKAPDGARERSRRAHVLAAPMEGGVVHQVIDLVRFDPLGPCDVVLPPWPGLDRAARRFAAVGARVRRLVPPPRAGGVDVWLAGRPVDLVHVHFATEHDGTPAVEAAAAHGIRTVSTDHVCAARNGDDTAWEARRRVMASQAAVLADSRAVAASLASRLRRQVRVLDHGIDVTKFADRASSPEARRLLGIPLGARVLGSIGALFSHKGMHRVVRAAAALGPDIVVLIAGEGPERPRLQALARGLGVDLRLPGWLEDVRTALAAMDVFALASDSEGLPTAVLEAMATGVPVVAVEAGGVGEALGTCGRIVRAADQGAFAGALAASLEARGSRVATRKLAAARRRVERRFDVRRLAHQVAAVHCAVLAGPRPAGTQVAAAVMRRRNGLLGRAAARGSS